MNYDAVTGLPTYESFIEFTRKMRNSDSRANRFGILSLNMNSFHKINQIYGYHKGDNLLSLITQKLIRSNDYMLTACRTHADSFSVLLDMEQLSITQTTAAITELILHFIQEIQPLYPAVPVLLHAGICILSNDTVSVSSAIDNASLARKSIHENPDILAAFYHDALLGSSNSELKILPIFDEIIENNHLIIYLQPKFDLDTMQPVGAEALVRLMDYNRSLLKPKAFLSVLEKHGLIYQLDLMVMESILKLIGNWISHGIQPLPISINLSKADFFTPEFFKIIDEMMGKYTVEQKYIEFEITESIFFEHTEYMIEQLDKLHRLGCHISMDDFGAGSLSLHSLGIPPVDTVKFDKNFINTSIRNSKNQNILKKLNEMFEECNISVICEGIESSQEEEIIRNCGCKYVQGYYYERPMPLDIFQKKYMHYSRMLSY